MDENKILGKRVKTKDCPEPYLVWFCPLSLTWDEIRKSESLKTKEEQNKTRDGL